MAALDELIHEHDVITRVLNTLEHTVRHAEATGEVPVDALRRVVVFAQQFIDRCHHGKEERCLIPCLERRGIPRDEGLIGVILEEHEMGRALVRKITAALDGYARGGVPAAAVLDPCREYLDLLHQHIFKENEMLFPLADASMEDPDRADTLRCFERQEAEMGPGAHEELERLAEGIVGGQIPIGHHEHHHHSQEDRSQQDPQQDPSRQDPPQQDPPQQEP